MDAVFMHMSPALSAVRLLFHAQATRALAAGDAFPSHDLHPFHNNVAWTSIVRGPLGIQRDRYSEDARKSARAFNATRDGSIRIEVKLDSIAPRKVAVYAIDRAAQWPGNDVAILLTKETAHRKLEPMSCRSCC